MRAKGRIWTLLFVCCWLCIMGEAAILRPYRRNPLRLDKLKQETRRPYSSAFKPTSKRCCNIGERVAKKNMDCDIGALAVFRKFSYEASKLRYSKKHPKGSRKKSSRGRMNKLSEKIAKCSAVQPKFFVKCCQYKQVYLKHRNKCKHKSRRQKRKCRRMIRKRFSYP